MLNRPKNTLLRALAIAGLIASWGLLAPGASATVLSDCPTTTNIPEIFAGVGLSESCGQTVTTGPNLFKINVDPSLTFASATSLESWLGLAPGGLNQTFANPFSILGFDAINAVGGAALQFPSFTTTQAGMLSFDWTGSFELGATGYLFYLLNDQFKVLDYRVNNGGVIVIEVPINDASIVQNIPLGFGNSTQLSVPLAPGNHSLAFGVVVGFSNVLNGTLQPCGELNGFNELCKPQAILLDPTLEVSNLSVPGTEIPEPGTVVLLGAGLLGLGLIARKRR